MPKQDGSLTDADYVSLVRVLDRMVPTEDLEPGAGELGILDEVEERARSEDSTRVALLRVAEALSLDLTAHAVGGFSAMTEQEQIDCLLSIERSLPGEFSQVLGIVRDVYYQDERTPDRPSSFDGDDEIFGKAPEEPEVVTGRRRGSRRWEEGDG